MDCHVFKNSQNTGSTFVTLRHTRNICIYEKYYKSISKENYRKFIFNQIVIYSLLPRVFRISC